MSGGAKEKDGEEKMWGGEMNSLVAREGMGRVAGSLEGLQLGSSCCCRRGGKGRSFKKRGCSKGRSASRVIKRVYRGVGGEGGGAESERAYFYLFQPDYPGREEVEGIGQGKGGSGSWPRVQMWKEYKNGVKKV